MLHDPLLEPYLVLKGGTVRGRKAYLVRCDTWLYLKVEPPCVKFIQSINYNLNIFK